MFGSSGSGNLPVPRCRPLFQIRRAGRHLVMPRTPARDPPHRHTRGRQRDGPSDRCSAARRGPATTLLMTGAVVSAHGDHHAVSVRTLPALLVAEQVTVVAPSGTSCRSPARRRPAGAVHRIRGRRREGDDGTAALVAFHHSCSSAPLPWAASRSSKRRHRDGEARRRAVCRRESTAEQTDVSSCPTGNVEPDAGAQVTPTLPSTMSSPRRRVGDETAPLASSRTDMFAARRR